ncbi:MAG: putative phage abortive infection protein [Bacteroidales bacterium]|jgi:hypothetical protein
MESKITKKEKENTKKIKLAFYVFLAVILVIGLFIISWWLFDRYLPFDKSKNILFQDKFTAISALFSGFAFAGVIFTIVLQSKELKLQRKELEDTRVELQGQKEAIQKQNELFDRQRFENTFFNLLQNLASFVESSEYKSLDKIYKGINSFDQMLCNLDLNNWKGYKGTSVLISEFKVDEIKDAEELYNSFSSNHKNLCLYFRMLYRIIKFVDESELTDYEKYQYTSFVRAQLSNSQLSLLFYNSTLGIGIEKFKPLVETWVLLKNIDKNAIGDKIEWINETAFERGERYNKPKSIDSEKII